MKSLGFIGKLMFAGPMVMFGIGHLTNANDMTAMVPNYLPAPIFFVYLTGIALILAAIAIVIGRKAKLATMLLGVMLLLFAILLHLPNFGSNPANFLKDLALAGAAWYMSSHLKD